MIWAIVAAGGVTMLSAIVALWYRTRYYQAVAVATRKEAERAREQREHNETLKALQASAEKYLAESEAKAAALQRAQERLREARLARTRAMSGDELLAAGNRLFGRHEDQIRGPTDSGSGTVSSR